MESLIPEIIKQIPALLLALLLYIRKGDEKTKTEQQQKIERLESDVVEIKRQLAIGDERMANISEKLKEQFTEMKEYMKREIENLRDSIKTRTAK